MSEWSPAPVKRGERTSRQAFVPRICRKKGGIMELLDAIKNRRSCRNYLPEAIDDTVIESILDAGIWAPSPLNTQPWEFIVITSGNVKERIFAEADRCRKWALEKAAGSGWTPIR